MAVKFTKAANARPAAVMMSTVECDLGLQPWPAVRSEAAALLQSLADETGWTVHARDAVSDVIIATACP